MTLKIGSLCLKNNLVLAPLAGITTLPFRLLIREFGAGLAFTEMVSAAGLTRSIERTFRYLASSVDDRPLGVQIFGADPAVMADAARIVTDHGAALVDINMGCPVPKVIRTGAGAALMRDPGLVKRIVRAVRASTPLPLTVKIRAGWDREQPNALEIGQIAEENGADCLILHARTARQGFGGQADWSVIARVKAVLGIPVIGNGDVRNGQDAKGMIDITGCDGVMIGRGALGNPWIFLQADRVLRGEAPPPAPSPAEREKILLHHYQLTRNLVGPARAIKDFRPHLLWYTKGLHGGAELRRRISSCESEADILGLLSRFIAEYK
ncbi:MAG: tRNA dihydrouridine synthase DusB [Smithellaceae bacterium]|nr:tRNA dihydrouridine synthase DusB [Smithellaceae bacterium]